MKFVNLLKTWLSELLNRWARYLINRENITINEYQHWFDTNPKITQEGYVERIILKDKLSEPGSTNFVARAETWHEDSNGKVKSPKKEIAVKICIPYSLPGRGRHHRLSMVLSAFSDEVRINNLIRSTNIEGVVRPLGGGQVGRILYFKMEYIQGSSLDSTITTDISDSEFNLRLARLAYLANTISQLHHYQVVHMDIKPKNLLFCEFPGSIREGKILICDFGYSNSKLRDTVQRYGGQLSPIYAAPEQSIMSQSNITCAADYFSFAVVAHEYLTGKQLFPKSLEIFTDDNYVITPKYLNHFKTGRDNQIKNPKIAHLINQLSEYESTVRLAESPNLFETAHILKEAAQSSGISDINTTFLDSQRMEYENQKL
jgi:serine/threonine protein kinase